MKTIIMNFLNGLVNELGGVIVNKFKDVENNANKLVKAIDNVTESSAETELIDAGEYCNTVNNNFDMLIKSCDRATERYNSLFK